MTWRPGSDEEQRAGWFGRPGGNWRGVRPVMDDPLSWSLPLGRYFGISVRLHISFVLVLVVFAFRAILPTKDDSFLLRPGMMLPMLSVWVVIVLLHELGHCFACRAAGGRADEVILWPLGGLAICQPGPQWRSHLFTALGGPLINLLICVLVTGMLGWLTNEWWGVAIPNPLDPSAGLSSFKISSSLPAMILYLTNYLSGVILLLNLLPMFPLDGGRVMQILLWPGQGYAGSMRIAVRVGYFAGMGLLILGIVTREPLLVVTAVFCVAVCYNTMRQVMFTAELFEEEAVPDESAIEEPAEAEHVPPRRQPARRAMTEADEAGEVDRILAKISADGMASLTQEERGLLERFSQRRREEKN